MNWIKDETIAEMKAVSEHQNSLGLWEELEQCSTCKTKYEYSGFQPPLDSLEEVRSYMVEDGWSVFWWSPNEPTIHCRLCTKSALSHYSAYVSARNEERK